MGCLFFESSLPLALNILGCLEKYVSVVLMYNPNKYVIEEKVLVQLTGCNSLSGRKSRYFASFLFFINVFNNSNEKALLGVIINSLFNSYKY